MSYDHSPTSKTESKLTPVDEIRILIVDDQSFARKFLEIVFEGDCKDRLQVIGMASNGHDALRQVELLKPNVAVIDLEMPGIDGLSVIKTITRDYPDCKILVFSSHDREEYISEAMQAGAKGYLLKTTPGEELRNAIALVNKGYYQVSPGLLEKAISSSQIVRTSDRQADIQDVVSSRSHLDLEPETELNSFAQIEGGLSESESISAEEDRTSLSQQQWSGSTQELLNTLPQVWSRGLIYLLIAFIAIGLPWTFLARVDETGTARGKIEPKGKTIELDTAVDGLVTKVHAKEGQQVQKGATLVSLESKVITSEIQQARSQLKAQQDRLAQLQSVEKQNLEALNKQTQQNQAQTVEKQAQLAQAQQDANSLGGVYQSQKQEKQAELEQAQKAIQTSTAAYELAQIRLQSAKEKVPRYQQAFKDGAISQDRLLETTQLSKEARKEVERSKFEMEQARSQFKEIQSSYQTLQEQENAELEQAQLRMSEQQGGYDSLLYNNDLTLLQHQEKIKEAETQIADLKGEIAQTKSKVESFEFQLAQYTIKAPTTGTIFYLPIKNKGTTVQSGDTIATIAPVDNTLYPSASGNLVLRAKMPSSQTAFIRTGLPAKVKLDAYPFQDYGVIEGNVSWISPDSKVDREAQPSGEDFFELEINLNRNYIEDGAKQVALNSGQTATAEVIIRQRRLIDFFLDPFKKLQKGGVDL